MRARRGLVCFAVVVAVGGCGSAAKQAATTTAPGARSTTIARTSGPPPSGLSALRWHAAEHVNSQGNCQGTSACVIHDVSCASTSLCVAIGEPNLVFVSVNPGAATPQWTSYALPAVALSLGGISCVPGRCVIGGVLSGSTYVSSNPAGGPSTWTSPPSGQGGAGNSVSCISATTCVSTDSGPGGAGGTVYASSDGGSSWTDISPPSAPTLLNSISCAQPGMCIAVGGGDLVTLQSVQPVKWLSTTISFPSAAETLMSASCPTSSFCAALSNEGTVVTSTKPAAANAAWKTVRLPAPLADAINCPAAGSCVAVQGSNVFTSSDAAGSAVTWHEQQALNKNDGFTGVSCPTTTLCVGSTGEGSLVNATP